MAGTNEHESKNHGSSDSQMKLPDRTKTPRQQLGKGMEHMRSYVAITENPTEVKSNGEDAYGVPAAIEPIRTAVNKPVANNPEKRSDPFQFGTRYLEEGDDIFAHNAWDHVEVDPQYDEFIEQQTAFQREHQVSDFDKQRFNSQPAKWWDRFYSNNAGNFFKDRKWLVQEFPVLSTITQQAYGRIHILEVGAGAGNTAFPLLAMNKNPDLRLHACDYSAKAINVIRSQTAYIAQGEPKILQADVWDLASTELPPDLPASSVDIVLMIFVFSALSPDQWEQAVKNVFTILKPGGEILFRDYGRGDLAQVRFKKDRYLDENFYVRGDGTRVYFFDEAELRDIWSGNSFRKTTSSTTTITESKDDADKSNRPTVTAIVETNEFEDEIEGTPGFEIDKLAVDRRMLVNRQRRIKMYRCWMQGRFLKPKS